jgi:Domain of unknown function (DUF4169)
MAEVIGFNRARKTLQKKKEEQQAAANRVAFGRTKAEKAADKTRKDQIARLLDGARLPSDNEPA